MYVLVGGEPLKKCFLKKLNLVLTVQGLRSYMPFSLDAGGLGCSLGAVAGLQDEWLRQLQLLGSRA